MVMSIECAGCSIAMLLKWTTKRNCWMLALARQNSLSSEHLAKLRQVQTLSSMSIMLPQQDKRMMSYCFHNSNLVAILPNEGPQTVVEIKD